MSSALSLFKKSTVFRQGVKAKLFALHIFLLLLYFVSKQD